jgi:hypothetical protein
MSNWIKRFTGSRSDGYKRVSIDELFDIDELTHGKGPTERDAFDDLARALACKYGWDFSKTFYKDEGSINIIHFGEKQFQFSTYRNAKTKNWVFVIINE